MNTARVTRVLVSVVLAIGALVTASGSANAAHAATVPGSYPTVQAAIDAAAPGSTITVARGTYVEQVVITKDVTLVGDKGKSVVRSPQTLTPFAVHLPDNRALTAIVRVGGGAHVRISGFTVAGPIPCGEEVTGVQVLEGATLSLSDSRVTGVQADPSTCAPDDAAGRAVVYGLPGHIVMNGEVGSRAFGSITNVTVDHYQHAGISVTGPATGAISNVLVADNDVRGGWTLPSFQYGIDVEDGVSTAVTGNRITGNVCGGPYCGPDPINQAQGTGINVVAVLGAVHIAHNRVDDNDTGIYQVVSPHCCEIRANRLSRNHFFGITIQDGDGRTDDNLVTGGRIGIGVVADFIDTTAVLNGDHIAATTVAPVKEIDCCGVTATAVVHSRHEP
jgi:nitrous oxidase accessory protein NosD